MLPLEAKWESPLPGLFQLLETTSIPWLMVPPFVSKVSSVASSNLSLTLLSPSSPYKTLMNT